MIILISGFMGVGKTTTAKLLCELYPNCVILSFASKIKEIAYKYFNWCGDKDIRGRKLLQNIGRAGREYDYDIWANYLASEAQILLNQDKIVIVDDWRYINELRVISNIQKPKLVRIQSSIRGGELNPDFVPDDSEYELLQINYNNILFIQNDFKDFYSYKEYLKNLHLI